MKFLVSLKMPLYQPVSGFYCIIMISLGSDQAVNFRRYAILKYFGEIKIEKWEGAFICVCLKRFWKKLLKKKVQICKNYSRLIDGLQNFSYQMIFTSVNLNEHSYLMLFCIDYENIIKNISAKNSNRSLLEMDGCEAENSW